MVDYQYLVRQNMRVYTYLLHKSYTLIALLFLLSSWQSLVHAQTNCVPPSVTFTASSSAVCQGQAITLSAVANPTGTYSYTINAPTGVTLSAINSATATATGLATGLNTFTVTVGNSQTCLTTATVSVNVSNPPTLIPVSVSLCGAVGTRVNLSTILTSNENTTALVGLTNTFIGANGSIGNPTSVSLTAGVNSFSVTSTSTGGCTVSTPITVSLTASPTLNTVITAITCNSATNQYTVSGTVSLTTTQAGTLTVTDGSVSTTLAVNSGSSAVPFTLPTQASGTNNHVVVASLPSCTTATITSNAPYTAPTSCTVGSPQLTLTKLVSNSVANIGAVLTYTLVVSNVGSAAASNVIVTDSVSVGLRYVANSATAPQGTTLTQGNPISTWTIGTIANGQTISLIFQAVADSAGILYNKARMPNAVATVCTSIPYRVCVGDNYLFTLTAPAGRNSYRWYRTYQGATTELTGFTTNVLDVTAAGSYSLAVDSTKGSCPDFTCCPFIVIEDVIPNFSARTVPASCNGSTAQANGQLIVSNFQAGYTYQYSLGNSFNTAASLSGAAQVIPTSGIIATTLANPASPQTYTVRIYNPANCYTDVVVTLPTTTCNCPPSICSPFVLKQTRGVAHVGNRR